MEYKGKCDFEIKTAVSNKTGREYTALHIKIGNYEVRTPIFLNQDQIHIISQELGIK